MSPVPLEATTQAVHYDGDRRVTKEVPRCQQWLTDRQCRAYARGGDPDGRCPAHRVRPSRVPPPAIADGRTGDMLDRVYEIRMMHETDAAAQWDLMATGAYLPRVGDRVELIDGSWEDGRKPVTRRGTVTEVLHFDLDADIEDHNDTIVKLGARVTVREDGDG
jgi:hypothetical protein